VLIIIFFTILTLANVNIIFISCLLVIISFLSMICLRKLLFSHNLIWSGRWCIWRAEEAVELLAIFLSFTHEELLTVVHLDHVWVEAIELQILADVLVWSMVEEIVTLFVLVLIVCEGWVHLEALFEQLLLPIE